ncbi:MAG TPA: PilZ domain-containing protein [Spirochaetota bacterium]|nr:PilZ domain-containing protein [Spirochaetota bacterium]HOL55975.1 PilZ domain-containing protein [Spirochaetota bacterium]HPP03589.1 PilZ domain-containing protein [Spirochaetota bacterium]
MANLSTQKLSQYYEKYNSKEVAFNKSIIKIVGLETKKVFLKIKGDPCPCVLYSASMKQAKVIINLDTYSFEEIKKANNFVNLRLSFFPKEAKSPITFFVPSMVKGYNIFKMKSSTQAPFLMTLEYTQKPPDDLIEILGKIIETAENFEKRKSLRINLEGKIIADIGLTTSKSYAIIDNIKRPCIIKNISAYGCMIILSCVPKFIMNKDAVINLFLIEKSEPLQIEGKIVRYEDVANRKDIYGIGIEFYEEKIPYEYKTLINNYLDKLEDLVKKK